MTASITRTIFIQPGAEYASTQRVDDHPQKRHQATTAELVADGKDNLSAFTVFPRPHRPQISPTNPSQCLNRETVRRTDLVRIFPNPPALRRVGTAVLMEQHDERAAYICGQPSATHPVGGTRERSDTATKHRLNSAISSPHGNKNGATPRDAIWVCRRFCTEEPGLE